MSLRRIFNGVNLRRTIPGMAVLAVSVATAAIQPPLLPPPLVPPAKLTTDGWVASSASILPKPARSMACSQPRPSSAPTAPDGHAVELTGVIEIPKLPRQPRPLSAAPRFVGDQGAL